MLCQMSDVYPIRQGTGGNTEFRDLFMQKDVVHFFAQKVELHFFAKYPSPHAHARNYYTRDVCVLQEYVMCHIVYHITSRDTSVLLECESL